MTSLCLSDLESFYNLLYNNFEYCGNFELIDNNLVIQDNSVTIGEKGVCQHKYYSKYIWHTHPFVSKSYPSAQDVLKIIKRSPIHYSIIFTSKGIWVLKYPYYINMSLEQAEEHLQVLKRLGDKLYYNFEPLKYKEALEKRYKKFKIDFYPWADTLCFI